MQALRGVLAGEEGPRLQAAARTLLHDFVAREGPWGPLAHRLLPLMDDDDLLKVRGRQYRHHSNMQYSTGTMVFADVWVQAICIRLAGQVHRWRHTPLVGALVKPHGRADTAHMPKMRAYHLHLHAGMSRAVQRHHIP